MNTVESRKFEVQGTGDLISNYRNSNYRKLVTTGTQ